MPDNISRDTFSHEPPRPLRVGTAFKAVVFLVAIVALFAGCATRAHRPLLPDEDLTAYERAVIIWTSVFPFRRLTGGDDMVSAQDQVTHRPSHEHTLLFRGILFADSLTTLDQERFCEEDTTDIRCDSLVKNYNGQHRWPDEFRVEVRLAATWTEPLQLNEMTIFLQDEDKIDYEATRTVFGASRIQQQTYVDQSVTRYNPYSMDEYRYYRLERGSEFNTRALATLYFSRINVVGKDLLAPGNGALYMVFKKGRQEYGRLSWDMRWSFL